MAGLLYGWGEGSWVAFGGAMPANAPTLIGSEEWSRVACGDDQSTLAIHKDGTLWGCGYNTHYVLGLPGSSTTRYVMTQISTDQWAEVACNWMQSHGIKKDGTLWSWGYNHVYQLGLGYTGDVQTPTQVGLETWNKVAAFFGSTLAIRSDGTLWAVGGNYNGQLGVGDTTTRQTLTQVGDSNQWVDVCLGNRFAAGIQADGSLWMWGYNIDYQLGQGDTTPRYTPTKVGAGSWSKVACGMENGTALAIASDGSLWGWGGNQYGELGVGHYSTVQTPAKIGSDTNWSDVKLGSYHSVARKSNGSLWVCGDDDYIGLGANSIGTVRVLERQEIPDLLAERIFVGTYNSFLTAITNKLFWTNFSGQTEIL